MENETSKIKIYCYVALIIYTVDKAAKLLTHYAPMKANRRQWGKGELPSANQGNCQRCIQSASLPPGTHLFFLLDARNNL